MYVVNGGISGVLPSDVAKLNWAILNPLNLSYLLNIALPISHSYLLKISIRLINIIPTKDTEQDFNLIVNQG